MAFLGERTAFVHATEALEGLFGKAGGAVKSAGNAARNASYNEIRSNVGSGLNQVYGGIQKVYGGFRTMMSETVVLEQNSKELAGQVLNAGRAANRILPFADSSLEGVSREMASALQKTADGKSYLSLNPLESYMKKFAKKNVAEDRPDLAMSDLVDTAALKQDLGGKAAIAGMVAGALGAGVLAGKAIGGAYDALND